MELDYLVVGKGQSPDVLHLFLLVCTQAAEELFFGLAKAGENLIHFCLNLARLQDSCLTLQLSVFLRARSEHFEPAESLQSEGVAAQGAGNVSHLEYLLCD